MSEFDELKRLDWSLKHGAIQGNQNDLLWCEWTDQNNTEVKEFNLKQNCTNPRSTIDALMKGE